MKVALLTILYLATPTVIPYLVGLCIPESEKWQPNDNTWETGAKYLGVCVIMLGIAALFVWIAYLLAKASLS
jgi:hypothetical protein